MIRREDFVSVSAELKEIIMEDGSIEDYLRGIRAGTIKDDYTNVLAALLYHSADKDYVTKGGLTDTNIRLVSQYNGLGAPPVDWLRIANGVPAMYFMSGSYVGYTPSDTVYVVASTEMVSTKLGDPDPLSKQCRSNLSAIVDYFDDFDINAKNASDVTILMQVVYQCRNIQLMQHLLDLGADPHVLSEKYGSALHFVFNDTDRDALPKFKALLSHGMDPTLGYAFMPYYMSNQAPLSKSEAVFESIRDYIEKTTKTQGAYLSDKTKFMFAEMLQIISRFEMSDHALSKSSEAILRRKGLGL